MAVRSCRFDSCLGDVLLNRKARHRIGGGEKHMLLLLILLLLILAIWGGFALSHLLFWVLVIVAILVLVGALGGRGYW